MANVYTVTASTSVVLINTLQTPNTVVLLSSVVNPGHIVGIRDGTGSALIASRPIVISTTRGIKFYDGSFSTLLTQPNTSLIVSSRNPTTWQILNNQAFFTSLSSVALNQVTTSYGNVTLLSSTYDVVSSMVVTNINLTKSFTLLGDDYHFDSVTVLQASLFSTITMNTGYFSTTLTVVGDVNAASSFQLRDSMTGRVNMAVASDVFVRQNLLVSSALILQEGALLPKNLSVQTLSLTNLNVGGFTRVAGTLNVASTFQIGQSLLIASTLTLASTLSTVSIAASNLNVAGPVQASTLSVTQVASIQRDTSIVTTQFFNTLSTLGTFQTSSIASEISTIVKGNVYISSLYVSSAIVQNQAFLSSLFIGSTLGVGGNLSITNDSLLNTVSVQGKLGIGSNLTVLGNTSILNSLSTQANVYIGGNLYLQGFLSTLSSVKVGGNLLGISTLSVAQAVSTANLYVKSTLFVQGTMSIMGNLTSLILSSPNTVRSVSTLQVSTQITAQNAYVSYLATSSLTTPTQIYVNMFAPSNYTLAVGGTFYTPGAQISSVVATTVQASSLQLTGSLLLGSTTSLTANAVINTAARFQSTLYSDSVLGRDIYTSTGQANYFIGDGSNLSNIVNYTPNPTISFLSLSTVYTTTFLGQSNTVANRTVVGNSLTINSLGYDTTTSLVLAAGSDFSNVDVKTSYQGGAWLPSASGLFDGVATSLVTNQNSATPIYVVVGQSPNPLKTIQWSTDGSNWNNSLRGGFYGGGGNDVAYSPTLNMFVAVGKGTANILYSGDGSNWSNSPTNFIEYSYSGVEPYNRVKWGSTEFMAIRTSPAYGTTDVTYEIKYSSDGINWTSVTSQTSNTATTVKTSLSMNTFGFSFSNYWYLIDNQKRINYLTTLGASYWSWSLSVPSIPYAASFLNSIWLIGCSNAIVTANDLTSGSFTTNTVASLIDTFAYDTVYSRYIAGGTSTNPLNTLFTSSNASTWIPLTTGGYYSGILSYAAGYGVFTGPNFKGPTQSTTSFFFGTGSIDGSATTQSLLIVNNDSNQYSTIYTVTGAFSNGIRGMAYYPNATKNKLVAVGDGPIPLKTIGLYSDSYSIGSNISTNTIQFNQIFSGGFSSIGYGVTYYSRSSLWLAVGVHNFSANTIQYSVDGSNWKPTNYSTPGVRLAATSITWGEFKGNTKILVTGSDPLSNRCIVMGDDTFSSWRATLGSIGFSGYQANASAMSPELAFVVGTRNSNATTPITETIKYTTNMSNWNFVNTGGFSNAGYGVAVKYPIYPYIIGGNSAYGASSNDTVKYSSDGINWCNVLGAIQIVTQALTYANGMYIASGDSGTGISSLNVMYSYDGKNWSYGFNGLTANTYSITYFPNPWNGSNIFYMSGMEAGVSAYSRFSYDGIYWSTIKNPLWNGAASSGYLNGVTYFNSRYISFGVQVYNNSLSNMMYSTDLLTWTNGTNTFRGGSTANAAANNQLLTSFAIGLSDTGTPLLVASAGSPFYHPRDDYKLKYTTNGINWSNVLSPNTKTDTPSYLISYVAYGGGKWLWLGKTVTYYNTGNYNQGYYTNTYQSIWYSTQGSNNYTVATNVFSDSGISASYNSNTGLWIATGVDVNGYKVKYSGDGINWSNSSGSIIYTGTSSASSGAAMPPLSTIVVAVGDPGSSNSLNSIQYSYDGRNFYPPSTTSAYIKGIGYGVSYNPAISTFFAVGKDATGNASSTILRSIDGLNWSTNQLASFSNTSFYDYQKGFPSQSLTGNTRRVTFQYLTIPEGYPFVQTSNLTLYERPQTNNLFSTNTLRYASSFMTFNETLSFNLSSQMMINSNTPYPGASLTVNGSVYASSIVFTANQNQVGSVFLTSTMTVSTLYLQSSLITYGYVSSGTLAIAQQSTSRQLVTANQIVSYMGKGIKINSLTVSPSSIGINTSTPQASLQIGGTTGSISTFAGTVFTSLSTINAITNTNTLMSFNSSFGLFSQSRTSYSTSMIATSNFLSFNNLFYLRSVSSIGIGTSSPAFSLDVRYPVNTYSILSSPSVTIQVLRPSVVYL